MSGVLDLSRGQDGAFAVEGFCGDSKKRANYPNGKEPVARTEKNRIPECLRVVVDFGMIMAAMGNYRNRIVDEILALKP